MIETQPAEKKDFEGITELLKKAFPGNKLFQQDKKKVSDYLSKVDGTFYVVFDDEKIIGTMLLSAQNFDDHSTWKIKYAAIFPGSKKKDLGIVMIEYVDKKIRRDMEGGQFKTAKIEVEISENDKIFARKSEKNDLEFWKRNGFKIEKK